MTGSGFEYLPASLNATAASLATPRLGSSWWQFPNVDVASRHGYGVFTNPPADIDADAPANQSYEALSVAGKETYDLALDGCVTAAMSSVAAGPQVDGPELVHLLEASISEAVHSGAPSIAELYSRCMDAASGYAVDEPEALYDAAISKYAAKTKIWDLDPSSPEYQQLAPDAGAFERSIAVADASCRLAVADRLVPVLELTTEQWATAHQEDFNAIRTAWRALVGG